MTTEAQELERLREQLARQSIVTETVSDAIITIDEESTILFANRAAGRVFGYESGELVGAKLTMLMPDYLRRVHEAGLARYVETGTRHIAWDGVELPGLHSSGRDITLEVSFGEFRDERGRHYFTGVARDVTERKRAERYQATLHALTRVLAEAPTTEAAVAGILRTVCDGLGWEMGALWSLDPASGLRCVETWHAPHVTFDAFEAATRKRVLVRGEGLPGRVWETRAPTWVRDVQVDDNFTRIAAARADEFHAAFAFPVPVRGEVVGVIEFFSREVREPDADLLSVVVAVGGQIGQVMERKRAEDERARLQAEVIRMQEELLAELSTPLIPVTDRIVVMPLVGAMDSKRAARLLQTLLGGIVERRPAVAIIDITGVSTVDTHVASTLIQASQAARLLGTEVVLTGIRAGVARTLTGLGVELDNTPTRKSLQSGLAYALERIRANG